MKRREPFRVAIIMADGRATALSSHREPDLGSWRVQEPIPACIGWRRWIGFTCSRVTAASKIGKVKLALSPELVLHCVPSPRSSRQRAPCPDLGPLPEVDPPPGQATHASCQREGME
ncbi:hypothetical protein GJAV_G00242130 [Gymnothorax javanicus]|nr:hypothetical protein GJAV_G00242130 [Gymnothorax javanicus]